MGTRKTRLYIYVHHSDGELTTNSHLDFPINVPVSLGGTLRIKLLQALPDWYYARSFEFFDWPEPLEPDNVFSSVATPAGAWDLSQLYPTGEIRLTARYTDGGDFHVDRQLAAPDIN